MSENKKEKVNKESIIPEVKITMANETKQEVTTTTTPELVSPIAFGKLVNKPAQQIYQMISKGRVPQEVLMSVTDAITGNTRNLFKKEEGLKWWAERPVRVAGGQTKTSTPRRDRVAETLLKLIEMVDVIAHDNPSVKALQTLSEGLHKQLTSASEIVPADIMPTESK